MDKKKIIIRIARVLAFSLVICAVSVGLFYLYSTGLPKIMSALEKKGNMDNTIEGVTHLLPMFNIAGLIIALVLMYKPVRASLKEVQTEKGWIMLIAAVFTYAVILSYVIKQSEGCFDPLPEGVEDVKSLLERTASWFVVQVIPFMIVITYHFVRASAKQTVAPQVEAEPIAVNEETGEQNEE